MDTSRVTGAEDVSREGPGTAFRPHGLVDLRGQAGAGTVLSYPADAVVVVSGLPGSGKSTLLRRWSRTVPAVDPRDVHVQCESLMPEWLPYAVYRPWARLVHFRRLRAAVRGGGALLVHDCGSRPWMRRWLARAAARQGRELHLVLLDVGATEALAGQEARGRWAAPRVFTRHGRGLDRLLRALSAPTATGPYSQAVPAPTLVPGATRPGRPLPVPDVVSEVASVVLLDQVSRGHAAAEFGPDRQPPGGARQTGRETHRRVSQ
ncbi:AAA family ATPase [Kitasatospora sp. GP82]|uniref:AAA family ATPase n=1 Tax=Kitasatospora sp. GP82 TaxID=3035089 RepID=UPI00247682D4|nr:AAA family ATPase [Kitasatospora sp. GP82]MDH6126434.1 hypothetical protein [Kitasatospora sp. GP82]